MAIAAASLADGQLPASSTVLYTCPGTKAAHLHVHLGNTDDANGYTVNILIKRSGSSARSVSGKNRFLAPTSSASCPDGALAFKLSAGDAIYGYASAANVIDYVITGGTEDA